MTQHSSTPLQTVHLHIWGIARKDHKENICRTLEGMKFTLKTEYNVEDAFQPGGVKLMNVAWGDMPSGLPHMLASYNLSMSWLTSPVGHEHLGSWLSHAGTKTNIAARSWPPHKICDKAVWRGHNQGDANEAAATLLAFSQKLGTHWALSAHEIIQADAELLKTTQAKTLSELIEQTNTKTIQF